ncbi:hypothetical protein [Rhodococcus sp. 24CO]|uniref:hypothetical protein n=1 Tax=Rhodococcus sp. 24CO TaxID=3117460 RepID=UPI003D3386A6
MGTEKQLFLATRLDELIRDLEADAPSAPAQGAPGHPDGLLVTAQRHRAEVDTADAKHIDEIMNAHSEIAAAWSSRSM